MTEESVLWKHYKRISKSIILFYPVFLAGIKEHYTATLLLTEHTPKVRHSWCQGVLRYNEGMLLLVTLK